MKKGECYITDNGRLERDPLRAKAWDIHDSLRELDVELCFSDCLLILENFELIAKHIDEYRSHIEPVDGDPEK